MLHPLTKFRSDFDMSMEAFAASIGASKGMVSKWERWLARPNERYMQLIFDVTNGSVTPNDFYRISSPASSSAGDDAGALVTPPAQKGAPASLSNSHEVLPSGGSGAQFADIGCAPVALFNEVAR